MYDIEFPILPPFRNHIGFGWIADVPGLPLGETTDCPFPSPLLLFEDGRPLGPAHRAHSDIGALGNGRYSHWQDTLFFSASDNSDPTRNHRKYTAVLSTAEMKTYIRQAADHAIDTLLVWFRHLGSNDLVTGKVVCEIGPGADMAMAILLTGLGAHCCVIDRVSHPWHPMGHKLLIEEFASRRDGRVGTFRPERLEKCLQEDGFSTTIPIFQDGLENADLAGAADFTLSASTFEHLADLDTASRALWRMTKPGGRGVHCVDYRDHRDFSKPLEFLALSENEYLSQNAYRYSVGNRVRASGYRRSLEAVGFSVTFVPGLRAPTDYLDEFVPRLRRSGSTYSAETVSELSVLNGVYSIVKT